MLNMPLFFISESLLPGPVPADMGKCGVDMWTCTLIIILASVRWLKICG